MERYQECLEQIFYEKDVSSAFTEEVSLTICCPQHGWMPSRLRIGNDIFLLNFHMNILLFLRYYMCIIPFLSRIYYRSICTDIGECVATNLTSLTPRPY